MLRVLESREIKLSCRFSDFFFQIAVLKILVQLQGVIARSLYLRRFTNAQVYSVVPTLRIAYTASLDLDGS